MRPPSLRVGDIADIDVCICTYERPEIIDALKALSRQASIAPSRFRVVVADNSRSGSAREGVEEAATRFALDLAYVHAPAANISIARNACLDAAQGEWIAFLDDDERPVADWLLRLLEEARRGGWSAVLGPVYAIYPEGTPDWLLRGDFHSTEPVWRRGGIAAAFSGNILFRRALAKQACLRFRPELGISGGEDEDFFDRFRAAGGTLGFAPRAVCYERVPSSRLTLSWLMRRKFRAGQSHGTRLLRGGARAKEMLLAASKAVACGVGASVHAPNAAERNQYLLRAALHAGVLARLCGMKEIAIYGGRASG